MEQFQPYLGQAYDLLVTFGIKIIGALAALIIGFWVIRIINRSIKKIMNKRSVDASLQPFLAGIINVMLKIVLIISVISMAGVETTSFIAVIGSAGLAIGLALQGSLANFAGGVLILTVKPFQVGDYIATLGESGTVHKINILNTILKTPNNQTIFMPNGSVAASTVTNYSTENTRRLVIDFGISYGDPIDKAKQIIHDEIQKDSRIMEEPASQVVVSALGDNAVNISMRVWTTTDEFWGLNFDLHERVKNAFDENGITIPFPQRDVHMYNN